MGYSPLVAKSWTRLSDFTFTFQWEDVFSHGSAVQCCAKSLQPCPTLCDPMDCSPPGSSVHGIFQTRILECVAISVSRGSSRPRDRTQVSHIAGRCFNLCTTREALKYKNTVSQKISYRDTELQIQVLTSKISTEERKPG